MIKGFLVQFINLEKKTETQRSCFFIDFTIWQVSGLVEDEIGP